MMGENNATDVKGLQTLEAVAVADRLNVWMLETIKPFCKGRILEVGSGMGNISDCFITSGYDVVLSDLRKEYCDILVNKYAQAKNCEGVKVFDLSCAHIEETYPDLVGQFDTVVVLNVVEHIYNDQLALFNCSKLLRKNGHVIILVPAYQWMYNRFDKGLEHYRRYTKKSLRSVMSPCFSGLSFKYFNFVGMFGWLVSAHLLRNDVLPSGQMKLYNKLVPVIRVIDKLVLNKIGLSVIGVGAVDQ